MLLAFPGRRVDYRCNVFVCLFFKKQLIITPQKEEWLLLLFLLFLLKFTFFYFVFLFNSSPRNYFLSTYNVLGSEQNQVPALIQLAF